MSLCPQYSLDDLKRKSVQKYGNWDGLADSKESHRKLVVCGGGLRGSNC